MATIEEDAHQLRQLAEEFDTARDHANKAINQLVSTLNKIEDITGETLMSLDLRDHIDSLHGKLQEVANGTLGAKGKVLKYVQQLEGWK